MRIPYALISVILAFICLACKDKEPVIPSDKNNGYDIDWSAVADSSSSKMVYSFWNSATSYFNANSNGSNNFNYWPQAHALDVMVDAYERSNDNLYLSTINSWYDGVKGGNGNSFYNVFYDDMLWNSLAMLRTYNATTDERYLTACLEVWGDIKTGWNDQAGGGIAWKKDQLWSKNAVSNAPASILAARLYQQFGDADNLEWATKTYDWQKENLYNPTSGAVYDNVNANTGEVKMDWLFTYNQGTFIGASLELYNITGQKSYLNTAQKAADYTMASLVNFSDAMLKDEGGGDGGLFKGIFIRYFTQLILHPDLSETKRKRYISFLEHNAKTLWNKGVDKRQILFGTYWGSPPGVSTDLTTQTSGAMLLEAMSLLSEENMLD